MTTNRDFDRITRAWLDLMPDEAPDRTVQAVLQAVESTSQVRRPWTRPIWRSTQMNRLSLLAAAAAVVVLVGGGLILANNLRPAGVGAPTASPDQSPATPSPTASFDPGPGGELPASLRFAWIGDARPIPDIPGADHAVITFSATAFAVSATASTTGPRSFRAAAVAGSSDLLELTATSASGGCAAGDAGEYRWSLSPGGTRLFLDLVADPCAARAAIVPGEWARAACKDPASPCLGDLEAGTHQSQFIAPRYQPDRGSWSAIYGAIGYTVPDGWANSSDWPNLFALRPSSEYAQDGINSRDTDGAYGIYVFTRPAAVVQDGTCGGTIDQGVERTAAALADRIASLPGIDAGSPVAITIGGRPAVMVDVAVAPSWTQRCPFDPAAGPVEAIDLLVEGVDAGEVPGWGTWGYAIFPDERVRFIFVDLGEGDVVAIIIDDVGGDRFDELIAAAMPIAETFTLK